MSFFERFERLCEAKGLKPQSEEIMKILGVSSPAISGWKNKGSIPQGKILTKIAQYFNVSVEYLLKGEEMNIEDTALRNILKLIKEKGLTDQQFAKDLGFYESIVSEWRNGSSKSYRIHLRAIADYFGVSLDSLTGKITSSADLTDDEIKILTLYRNLDEDGRNIVLGEALKQKQRVQEEVRNRHEEIKKAIQVG